MPELHFLADEGFSYSITNLIKSMGYDVKWIGDTFPSIEDEKIFEIALAENRIILTEDKDFGELAIRFKCRNRGIILLRIDARERTLREERVAELIQRFPEKLLDHFTVINSKKFRFRKI